uniref:THAP domaincontaining protein 9like [Hydra vulgaris] n=1 Tax=Lepeophtheirus salmonis TaxID=72036 RepID=A0A0K2UKN6_LEPSM
MIEFDGSKYYGYVDIGTGVPNDSMPPATEVLVLMVVAIHGNWKIHMGNFMIHELCGRGKANLVCTALSKVYDMGIIIPSITCDGPSFNFAMFNSLGVVLCPNNLETTFPHPSNHEIKNSSYI